MTHATGGRPEVLKDYCPSPVTTWIALNHFVVWVGCLFPRATVPRGAQASTKVFVRVERTLSDNLASEHSPARCHVRLVYTPLQISGGPTVEHFKNFGADYPLARVGQPCELASIYVQLAANDASYTTGNIYGAGGGKGQP